MSAARGLYAVVPSPGCYGSGSRVRPVRVLSTFERARRYAEAATADYRNGMPGHTSGGYRVVEAGPESWFGWELDQEPTLEGPLFD